ncbi:MAG: iron-containing alcohol dehydrogenase, partial [Lachnospiraceae bacterium]
MRQSIYEGTGCYQAVEKILKEEAYHKALVVCGGTFKRSLLPEYFESIQVEYFVFDKFKPNPTYEDIVEGRKIFLEQDCDFLISVGGGSAIDVAKCIKAYLGMDENLPFVEQEIQTNDIKHLAMPSTAGTGSESTHFAVMYYQGNKQSVAHDSLLPEYVILEPTLLETLPDYQKKSTLLDALCQATESYWAVKSNEESRDYSKKAISLIMRYGRTFINENTNQIEIYRAANYAGRAINITQTTLAHAMSYKLTSLYGIPHGHAVAICMPYVWEFLASHTERCEEEKRKGIEAALEEINRLYGCKSTAETVELFQGMLLEYGLTAPQLRSREELDILTDSVNPDRMKNFPVPVERQELYQLYEKILNPSHDDDERKKIAWIAYNEMKAVSNMSERRREKAMGFLPEEYKEEAVTAVKKYLDAIWYLGHVEDNEKIEKVVRELQISVRGYLQEDEIDLINYRNAEKLFEEFCYEWKEADEEKQKYLQEELQFSKEHAELLCEYQMIYEWFGKQEPACSKIFHIQEGKLNQKILKGLMCQMGLLSAQKTSYKEWNKPKSVRKTYQYVIYWNIAGKRTEDEKFAAYLSKLHEVQLEMMDEIARVCDENGLRYYLNH